MTIIQDEIKAGIIDLASAIEQPLVTLTVSTPSETLDADRNVGSPTTHNIEGMWVEMSSNEQKAYDRKFITYDTAASLDTEQTVEESGGNTYALKRVMLDPAKAAYTLFLVGTRG